MNNAFRVAWVMLQKVLVTLRATLQEIFDEQAYARFLNRTGMASSAQAYAAFRREFEEVKMRRPKCC